MAEKIVISFDFELGWGVLDSTLWKQREDEHLYEKLRPVISSLSRYLVDRHVPATWAMVASMLEDNASQIELDHLPQDYQYQIRHFLEKAKLSTRCALDLVDELSSVLDFSEIATHTSTHIYAGYDGLNEEQYCRDVDISITKLEKYFGRRIKSLVFPRDHAQFRGKIAEIHPLNMRLNPSFGKRNQDAFRRLATGATRIYKNIPVSRIYQGVNEEQYQTGSLYYNWSGGKYAAIKKRLLKIQSKRLVSSLGGSSSVYHVWLHPFNLAETKEHFDVFINFLDGLVAARDRGHAEIVTMEQLNQQEEVN